MVPDQHILSKSQTYLSFSVNSIELVTILYPADVHSNMAPLVHMLLSFLLLVIRPVISSHTYRTSNYRGFDYILDSELTSTFNETRDWCKRFEGMLPSVHSREDQLALINFVKENFQGESHVVNIFLGNIDKSAKNWEDGTPLDWEKVKSELESNNCYAPCCGLFMPVFVTGPSHRTLVRTNTCNRKGSVGRLCKFETLTFARSWNRLIGTPDDAKTTTPPINMSVSEADIKIASENAEMSQDIIEMAENIEVLQEAVYLKIKTANKSLSDSLSTKSGRAVVSMDALDKLDSMNTRITLLAFAMVCATIALMIYAIIPGLKTIVEKKRSGDPIVMRDLVS